MEIWHTVVHGDALDARMSLKGRGIAVGRLRTKDYP